MLGWWKRFRTHVRWLAALSISDSVRVLETFVMLGLARILLLAVPFKSLATMIGNPEANTSLAGGEGCLRAEDALKFIRIIAQRVFWRAECLEQAIAGGLMLRLRGLHSSIVLGVRKEEELEAHAWLVCGGKVLVGDESRPGFSEIFNSSQDRELR